MEENKRAKSNYYIFMFCIYILIFQDLIKTVFEPMIYFDEFISLLVVPIFIVKLKKNNWKIKKNKYEFIIILCICIIYIFGFLSNILFKNQRYDVAFKDMFLFTKFFCTYFLSKLCIDNNFINDYKKRISSNIKIIIFLFFILTVLNYKFNFFAMSVRNGKKANELFYSRPTYLAASCIFILELFILTDSSKFSRKILFVILDIITLCSTLRYKAIGFASIAIVITIYLYKRNNKITMNKIGILALVAVLITWNQISYYFLGDDSEARYILLNNAIKIAKEYFPIGAGFGTYGSYMSEIYYSPLYYKYGMDKIYGLSKSFPAFITDSFWPMIIGQFGIIGLVCYIIIIIMLFLNIQKEYSINNKSIYIAKILCLIYLLISSTAESAFTNTMSVSFAIILGINIKEVGNEKRKNEQKDLPD